VLVGCILNMRKILALTSIRSEYDLMSRLYQILESDKDVDLQLLVSGAHLSPAHGYTVENIRDDGLSMLAEIETLISADSLSSRLKTASGLLSGSIDVVKKFAPDIIIYAGDREDVLIGGMLGLFLCIPTVHFFGGDHATDGHIDNPLRHATSKLSSAHFVSTLEHKKRLIRLGEPEERIFVIGSVALDKFIHEPVLDKNTVLKKMGANDHAYTAPLAIFIFHPISEEREIAGDIIIGAVSALIEQGFHVCIGAPNTDPGNFKINQVLENLSQQNEVTYYKNLTRSEFINLFRNSTIIVGNSSAGLLEAATLKIPTINIGARQRGRLCGANVVFTDGSYESIAAALHSVMSPAFQANLKDLKNPYGDGSSSESAAQLLKTYDFSRLVSKPEDPLNVNQ
jgi:UDP-hydrolysing UDP-N-acetyl-D-glucosamine 2-epimerase